MDKSKMRLIPKVDQVISEELLAPFMAATAREVVVDAARTVIDEMRQAVLAGEDIEISVEMAAKKTAARLQETDQPSLRRVINATGIVLHTNMGRARLAKAAAKNVAEIAQGYSTLEFDLATGERGSRHTHVSDVIAEVTGAEAAIAVNNNAAATLITMMALCEGKQVLVSRGESVEIGGAFRIPEIMELSGAILKDVGTTNKTHLYDYERVIGPDTGAILKVHTSNYRVVGFSEDVSVEELAKLAHEKGLPMIYDMGGGLISDLQSYGIDEPNVEKAFKDGADLVLFSGDKLLGGPQAGIIAGKKELIEKIKKHQLARALRLDKMTLAALEATFRIYRDKKQALTEIPVLAMLTMGEDQLRQKAERLLGAAKGIRGGAEIIPETGRIGGGTAPMKDLKTLAVAISPETMSPDELQKALREHEIPIVVRINEGRVLIDMRTVSDDEIDIVAKALVDILV